MGMYKFNHLGKVSKFLKALILILHTLKVLIDHGGVTSERVNGKLHANPQPKSQQHILHAELSASGGSRFKHHSTSMFTQDSAAVYQCGHMGWIQDIPKGGGGGNGKAWRMAVAVGRVPLKLLPCVFNLCS